MWGLKQPANVGAHDWLDVFGYVLTATVTLIAVFLANQLARHAKERESVIESLGELRQNVEKLKGWVAGKFGVQL